MEGGISQYMPHVYIAGGVLQYFNTNMYCKKALRCECNLSGLHL